MKDFTIKGIQEVLAANAKAIAAIQPRGAVGRALKYAVAELHRYAVYVTHVDTGTLRASHRMELKAYQARVFVDPSSVNPRTGEKPVEYGLLEEKRGGRHAFYTRTVNERGNAIAARAIKIIEAGL